MKNLKKSAAVILAATLMTCTAITNSISAGAYDDVAYNPSSHTQNVYGTYYDTGSRIYTRSTSNRKFIWPVRSNSANYNSISASYRDDSWSWNGYVSRNHGAIDIAVPMNTPVVASAAGTVVYADWMSGFGYCVIIRHDGITDNYGSTIYTQYSHLNSCSVSKDAPVSQNAIVGYSGNSGGNYAAHLDFQVMTRTNNNGGADRMRYNYDPIKVVQVPSTVYIGTTSFASGGNPEVVAKWLIDLVGTGAADNAYSWAKGGSTPPPVNYAFPKDTMTGSNYQDAILTNFALNYGQDARQVPIGSPSYGIRKKNTSTSVYFKVTGLSNVTNGGVRVSTYGLTGLGWNYSKKNETLNSYARSVSYVSLSSGRDYKILNNINEDRYAYAGIAIASSNSGSNKKVSARWSPDSIGSGTNANAVKKTLAK